MGGALVRRCGGLPRRATGQDVAPPLACQPAGVQDTDSPARHAINAAWRHLDAWVRRQAPRRAQPLQMRVPLAEPFDPEHAFFTDDVGNARGGCVRRWWTCPWRATWAPRPARSRACSMDTCIPRRAAAAVAWRRAAVPAARAVECVQQLRREGWLTAEDAREIVAEARARDIGFAEAKALALPANSGPVTVTTSRDGSVWFTAGQGNYIGRFNADGSGLRQFALPNANSAPRIIALGGDGNVWFSEHDGNRIGRLTPRGELAEFPIPTPGSQPRAIALGADGNIWFGKFAAGKIGRITPQGVITEFTIPTPRSGPRALAAGPDGNIWFSEFRAGKIGSHHAAGRDHSIRAAARQQRSGRHHRRRWGTVVRGAFRVDGRHAARRRAAGSHHRGGAHHGVRHAIEAAIADQHRGGARPQYLVHAGDEGGSRHRGREVHGIRPGRGIAGGRAFCGL